MVYGYYYKTINKGPILLDDTCPSCGSKGTLRMDVICKVSHWMYIPCWPSDKQPILECSVCQGKYKTSALPHLHPKDHELLKRTSYRFYHFAGLILLLLFAGFFTYLVISGEKEKIEKIHKEIETLDEGLVINYKLPDKQKTSMYVDSVRGDSVWVRENKMATTGQVMRINTSENYSDEPTLYLKEELHKLANEERIINIYITAAYVRKQVEQENENENIQD
ncbi:hypothetical protein [Bacteroides sp. 519]|uniref:hypothetical protein n=1 Tax=Bacteroides sp. 519 TaxID=2302937 RepID=UPI0013D31335|nr:hypothetical protein [Bacteroides sp. 519]NDV59477.1 hypothetical protein [Bacteroides sp. 519]